MNTPRLRRLVTASALGLSLLAGCAVVEVAGAAAGAAISCTGAVVSTGVISMVTAFLMQPVGGLVLFTAVQGFFLATRGQTIGKMLLGLRIVRSDGERASLGRLIGLRYAIGSVIGVIPFIGVFYVLVDCLLIFRESHQCLHDNISDTIVVKA